MNDLYDIDLFAWSTQQGALLRQGDVSAADLLHLAEEIESLGRSQRDQLTNRLAVLLLHLLKWQNQPEQRGTSWRATIREQGRRIERVVKNNPSLRPKLSEILQESYGDALVVAENETGLPEASFPVECPWTFDQAMSLPVDLPD